MAPKKNVASARAKGRKAPAKEAKPNDMAKMLGAQLRAAREARGMQQVEAARALGWGKDRLCRAENGSRTISALDKARLCQLYGISESQLESLRQGDKAITGRYMSVPVIDRHSVAKAGGKFQLKPVANQTLCLDWLAPHVAADALRIVEGIRDEEAAEDAEFVVVDTSTTKVAQRGIYLLWSFSGSASLNHCAPDMASNKINVRQSPKETVAVAPDRVEVIGKVVGAWRRM